MAREEKLKELDQKIKETLEICSEMRIKDIRTAAKPLLAHHNRWRRRERLQSTICLAVVVAVIAALYQIEATSEFVSAVAKIGMVKIVLPYWDWTSLHSIDCVFHNPYFTGKDVTLEQCEELSGLTSVGRQAELTQDEMTENHLYTAVPVIITDVIQDWVAVKDLDFDIKFIKELYYEDPILSNTSVCGFSGKESTLHDFLDKIDTLDNYQVHWGHCNLPAAKVLRKFYQRPYFLPGMVEADTKNYVAIGRRKDHKKYPEYTAFLNFNMQMTWFSQIKGRFKYKLFPHQVCNETCNILEGALKPGETLVYCNNMWNLQYSAAGEEEAVAISSGGVWTDD